MYYIHYAPEGYGSDAMIGITEDPDYIQADATMIETAHGADEALCILQAAMFRFPLAFVSICIGNARPNIFDFAAGEVVKVPSAVEVRVD